VQSTVSLSTPDADFFDASDCGSFAQFLWSAMEEFLNVTPIYEDNRAFLLVADSSTL